MNQRFQKCEYAKTKLFRTEGRGWGLLADENIKEYNHVWENGDDRYTVEEVPLYDSAEDEFFPVISGTSGGNEHSKASNDGGRSNNTCRNYNTGSGSTPKKKSQRIPKRKGKVSSRKQVNDGDFAKMFASKEAREEVTKYEGIKNESTSKLNSVYEEIRPTIEEHGRDNQDSVPTSVAEKWIEANCSKYKADFDLYFSVIKNVMCPLPATDATAARPSEGGTGPQTANAEVKSSEGGAGPQTTNAEVKPSEGGAE